MEQATNAADASVVDVRDLTTRQTNLQTDYLKNERRVKDAKGRNIYLSVSVHLAPKCNDNSVGF